MATARGSRERPLTQMLLIDGYNVIFHCDEFEDTLESKDLEGARNILCARIAEMGYAEDAVVVFDGDISVTLPNKTRISSVSVVFSPSQSSADDEIEAILRKHDNPGSVTVVTSDRALAEKARAVGAKTIKVEDFLESGPPEPRKAEKPEPRVKFEGPGPEELRYWMRIFECEDEK